MTKKNLITIGGRALGEVVPHDICSYHSSHCVSNFDDFRVRAEDETIDENTIFIGKEKEVSRENEITSNMVEKVFDIFKHCQIEQDCSIPHYGMEIITAPMTLEALYNSNLLELNQFLLSKDFSAYAVTSEDNGNGCGGHIHLSKVNGWEDAVAIMAMFIDQNKYIVEAICQRPFTHYAYNVLANLGKSNKRYYLPFVKKYVLHNANEHSTAINLQHSNTIEFRLPAGTINYNTEMAQVEFIYYLYKSCLDIAHKKARLDRLTINKVCQNGKFLPNYMKTLGISCSNKLIVLDNDIKNRINNLKTIQKDTSKLLASLQTLIMNSTKYEQYASSYRTISRKYDSIAFTNVNENADGLQNLLGAIKREAEQNDISRGCEEIAQNEPATAIAMKYNELKEYLRNLTIQSIFENLKEEK